MLGPKREINVLVINLHVESIGNYLTAEGHGALALRSRDQLQQAEPLHELFAQSQCQNRILGLMLRMAFEIVNVGFKPLSEAVAHVQVGTHRVTAYKSGLKNT